MGAILEPTCLELKVVWKVFVWKSHLMSIKRFDFEEAAWKLQKMNYSTSWLFGNSDHYSHRPVI